MKPLQINETTKLPLPLGRGAELGEHIGGVGAIISYSCNHKPSKYKMPGHGSGYSLCKS